MRTRRPSGENSAADSGAPRGLRATLAPPSSGKRRATPSSPEVSTRCPSGEKRAPSSSAGARSTVAPRCLPRRSQTRAVPSMLAVSSRSPSGEISAVTISPVCPSSTPASQPVRASHT